MFRSKIAKEIEARAWRLGRITAKEMTDLGNIPHIHRLLLRMSAEGPDQRVHVVERIRGAGVPTPVYAPGPGKNAPKLKPLESMERKKRYVANMKFRQDPRSARRVAFIAMVEQFAASGERFTWKDVPSLEHEKYITRLLIDMMFMQKLSRVSYRRHNRGGKPTPVYTRWVEGQINVPPPPRLTNATKNKRWRNKNPDKVAQYEATIRKLPDDEKTKRAEARAAYKKKAQEKRSRAIVKKALASAKTDPLAGFLYSAPKKINTNF